MYECALDSRINNKKLQIISNSQKRRIKVLLCFTYIINIFRLNGFFIVIDFQEYYLHHDLKCPKICHIKILKAFHKQQINPIKEVMTIDIQTILIWIYSKIYHIHPTTTS